MKDDYLKIDQVCELLEISSRNFLRWRRSGYFDVGPYYIGKRPRWRRSEVETWRQAQKAA